MVDVIVFHDNCHDGVTAACIALMKYPNAELYSGRHGELPDLNRLCDRDILIVDFSWKRPQMLSINDVARSVFVLDHHASAEHDLAGFDWCRFDMNRSGAGLSWDYLFGKDEPEGHALKRPELVNYVEDRDLWRFALPRCREVHAACDSWPLTIAMRQKLFECSIMSLADEGTAILRYHEKLIVQAIEERPREMISGYSVPCVAMPLISLRSDVAGRLSEGEPFAATYTIRADGSREFSLRSRDNGLDVSIIAAKFGGGGHVHAAGFRVAAEVDIH
jgi:hypothetical protein